MMTVLENIEAHKPSSGFTRKVNEVITHYPESKRSAALPLLHLWQEQFGFISQQAVDYISDKLGLQPIHILELVTFYPMLREHAYGRFHIRVCRTLSCELGGAQETFDRFKKLMGQIGREEHGGHCLTSKDGKFTLEFVECLASCGTAPVVMINEDFYEGVTPEIAKELVSKCE